MTELSREFVGLPSPLVGRAGAGGHPCQGIYYTPSGKRPRTAVIACHYDIDFSEHYLASYLAERGYGFLGWNTRFRGDGAHFILDHALAEVGVGVQWVRENAGVNTVVLLGNSGGGSLMAAYQSQALDPNITPVAGMRPLPSIERLPPGDLYVALAAHPGRPEVLTNWMDASVVDEADPLSLDPDLDPFDPQHGPPYSRQFQHRYRAAQQARNERITDWVEQQLAALSGTRARDRVFNVHRTWADLRMIDPNVEPSDRRPNHCYLGEPQRANYGVFGIANNCTLRTWLSMWSLRTSHCSAASHLARITVPSLIIQASADNGVFDSDALALYNGLAASDKQLEHVKGDHYLLEPSGARTQVADLIGDWIREHHP